MKRIPAWSRQMYMRGATAMFGESVRKHQIISGRLR